MNTYTLLRTYTVLLDMLILSLLVLAVNFYVTDFSVANSFTNRQGAVRTLSVCWQTLLLMSGFCAALRYIARNAK